MSAARLIGSARDKTEKRDLVNNDEFSQYMMIPAGQRKNLKPMQGLLASEDGTGNLRVPVVKSKNPRNLHESPERDDQNEKNGTHMDIKIKGALDETPE